MSRKFAGFAFCLLPTLLCAQQKSDLQQILDRLDRIEQENKTLTDEVRALRAELASSRGATPPTEPPITERVAVAEQRIADQQQTKVEASQKLPITLTGMVLFNAWMNGRASGGAEFPTTASQTNSSSAAGATVSQSVLGMKFQGPEVLGGGQLSGSLYFDTWGGSPSNSLNHLIRVRTAAIQIDWKNTSIVAGQDKPIVSPREPDSLAQVQVSPLTGAGNLWLWQPQVRVDQRFAFRPAGGTHRAGRRLRNRRAFLCVARRRQLRARLRSPSRRRRTLRILAHSSARTPASKSHLGSMKAPRTPEDSPRPSRLFTVDWLIQPAWRKSSSPGCSSPAKTQPGSAACARASRSSTIPAPFPSEPPADGRQFSYLATKRLTFNIFGGQENDRAADLLTRRYPPQFDVRRQRHLPAGLKCVNRHGSIADPHQLLPVTVKIEQSL